MISCHEQRLCNDFSEVFIGGTFKCGAKSFLKCAIYIDYAMDSMYLFASKSIYHGMCSATECNSYTLGCPPERANNPRALKWQAEYLTYK